MRGGLIIIRKAHEDVPMSGVAAVNNHWTGLLDMYYWTCTGLDYWTCTGLDYWITNLTTRFQLRSIKFYLKSIMASKEVSIEAVKLL